jgi:hypothetical protein
MKLVRSLFAVLLLLLAVTLTATSCNEKSPTLEPTAAADDVQVPQATEVGQQPDDRGVEAVEMVPFERGKFLVAVEPAEILTESASEPQPLSSGDELDVADGIQIVVGKKGVGIVQWPEFLRTEMLTGADVVIDEVVPDERSLTLVQDAGTARYTLLDPDVPAHVSVIAGGLTVHLSGDGPADVIVSHGPEGYDTVWAVAIKGDVELDTELDTGRDAEHESDLETETGSETAAKAESEDSKGSSAQRGGGTTLSEGHVVAYVAGEGLSKTLPVDVMAVEVWYGDIASVNLKRTIAEVAFRCEVVADKVGLMADIEGELTQIGRLSKGALVEALGRNTAGDWVRIATISPVAEGWVPSSSLACAGSLEALLLAQDEIDQGSPKTVAMLAKAAAKGSLPPEALATPTPQSGQGADSSSRRHDRPKATRPPRVEPTLDPSVPTECVGPECHAPGPPPTATRRPRPPTKAPTTKPTKPPRPTKPPAPTKRPTEPPKPTEEPGPGPTATPPAPTAPPGSPTDAPPATPSPSGSETAVPAPSETPSPTETSTPTSSPPPTVSPTPTAGSPEPTEEPTGGPPPTEETPTP